MGCKRVLYHACQHQTIEAQWSCEFYRRGVADICAFKEALPIPPRCHCQRAIEKADLLAMVDEIGLLCQELVGRPADTKRYVPDPRD